ncbi:hypothetical protein Syun_012115 [Stephania yunnanensis]|uniref:Uncharacterized protein n=1 Tax=Stephania yunnanensis TaxID=152371 RepID=A0AAP0JZW3_9MAGN
MSESSRHRKQPIECPMSQKPTISRARIFSFSRTWRSPASHSSDNLSSSSSAAAAAPPHSRSALADTLASTLSDSTIGDNSRRTKARVRDKMTNTWDPHRDMCHYRGTVVEACHLILRHFDDTRSIVIVTNVTRHSHKVILNSGLLVTIRFHCRIVFALMDSHIEVLLTIVLTMPKGIVLSTNPYILDDTDDLVQLSFLNEPLVLHNLCCRYSQILEVIDFSGLGCIFSISDKEIKKCDFVFSEEEWRSALLRCFNGILND